jgi:Polyhydroxyalkanoic acid inclusion protein (PhaP_Bmeg)
MAQKKNETVQSAVETSKPLADESVAVGSFVNTFWDQFEQSRERAEQLRENREDAYINALREVIKFNKQFRDSVATLYQQSKKTNKDMVSELMQQLSFGKEEIKDEELPISEREELKKQFVEVSGQLEKLALTPIKSIFHLVDQMEDNFEKNAESSVAYGRDRRNAWLQVRKEYVKFARDAHMNLVDRSKSSLKELIKTQ